MDGMRIFLDARDDTVAVLHGEEKPWDVTNHGPLPLPSVEARGKTKKMREYRPVHAALALPLPPHQLSLVLFSSSSFPWCGTRTRTHVKTGGEI
jgi:hypothetical protein